MWVGCSTLYWAMFVPAFLNSAPAAGAAAAPALAAFSQVCRGFERPAIHMCGSPPTHCAAGQLLGMHLNCPAAGSCLRLANSACCLPFLPSAPQYVAAPLMIGSLVLEAVADYQQQKDKERQALAKAPAR